MSKLGRSLIKSLREAIGEDISTWSIYKDEPFFKRLWKVVYISDFFSPILNVYNAVDTFVHNILRVVKYTPLIWRHRNWDYGFILKLNIELHEDLYKGCFIDGCHVVRPKDMRRLRTIINLYKRLEKDEYGDWQYEYLNKKYGKIDYYCTKVADTENKPGGPYSTLRDTRTDRLTKEQYAAYRKEQTILYKLEERQRNQDFEVLGKYIARYSKRFWD